MRRDLVDGLLEDRHRWAQELVDRGADDDHEVVGPLDQVARRAECQTAGRQDLAQELVGAGLEERHLAGGDPVERRLVGVVDPDAQARLGEGEAQRQADVAAAAEHDDVEVLGFTHVPTVAARSLGGTESRWSHLSVVPSRPCSGECGSDQASVGRCPLS